MSRLYAPAVTRLRDGRVFLVWATADNKQVVSLEFASAGEFAEWMARAVLAAGPAEVQGKLDDLSRGAGSSAPAP